MAESTEAGKSNHTKDGSVDLKGNTVLRSNRGGWTACFFVVGTWMTEPQRHGCINKQCYKLGWNCLDDTHHWCLYCRCSSWLILYFHHCFSHLFVCKFMTPAHSLIEIINL